jgi:hypothetical protein
MSSYLDLQPESDYVESNEVKEMCKGGKQDQVDSSSSVQLLRLLAPLIIT